MKKCLEYPHSILVQEANPRVWHFTLRFVLPRSLVGYPSRRPKGCGMQWPSGPKVYRRPKGYAMQSPTGPKVYPCLGRGASDQSSWGSGLMCLPESVVSRRQIR